MHQEQIQTFWEQEPKPAILEKGGARKRHQNCDPQDRVFLQGFTRKLFPKLPMKFPMAPLRDPHLHTKPVRSHLWAFRPRPTLHRFQTRTVLFCSVFKMICVYTYRFRIVFARPHYNAYLHWRRSKTFYSLIFSLHSSSNTFLATN